MVHMPIGEIWIGWLGRRREELRIASGFRLVLGPDTSSRCSIDSKRYKAWHWIKSMLYARLGVLLTNFRIQKLDAKGTLGPAVCLHNGIWVDFILIQHVCDLVQKRHILFLNDEGKPVQGNCCFLDFAYKTHFVMANVNRACNQIVNNAMPAVYLCLNLT